MEQRTVKTKDAMKLLNMPTRQHLQYYIRKKYLRPKKDSYGRNNFTVEEVLKLKEHIESREYINETV